MGKSKLFDDDFLHRLERLGLIAKRVSASWTPAGQRRSRRLGDGLEFADHRAYSAGDNIRFLDWPYYARMGRLLVRLFHEHSEGVVTILLDCSGSMKSGRVCKFDYARRTAAALAYVAMTGLDRVGIRAFGRHLGRALAAGRNRGKIAGVLDFLESLQADGPTALGASIEQYVGRCAEPATVIIATDMLDCRDDLSACLAVLRHHGDEVVLLHITDIDDESPDISGPTRLGSEESDSRMDVDVTNSILAAYVKQWRKFVREVQKTALVRGAAYIQAPTAAPFDHLVLQTLQKAGVMRI